jgi:outer membrane protein OmpA-like peptidoglycan-associated protein
MFSITGRAGKILVGVLVAVVLLAAVFLAVLPEIVRRVAMAQIPELTGRFLLLDDVDLNVFTGHLALKGVKIQAPGTNERAYEIERIDVRLDYLPLFVHHVRLTEITLVAPKIQVLRRGPTEFDFSDILDRFKGSAPSDSSKEPSKWVVTLERVTIQHLTGVGRDRTTSPESVWRIDDLNLAANGLVIGPSAQPGRLQLSFRLNDAPITVTSDSLVLIPLAAKARATVEGFDVAPVQAYLPPRVPAAPRTGKASLAMAANIELAPEGLKRGSVRGNVTTAGLEVFQTGHTEPFLKIPRLDLEIKEADLVARSVTIGSLGIEGLSLRAVRDAQQRIDLLALAGPSESDEDNAPAGAAATRPAAAESVRPVAAESAQPAAAEPARADFKAKVEQIALRKAELAFRDEAVKPLTTLTVTDLSADVKDISWPPTGPATFAVSMQMPKSGRVEMKGSVTPLPFDIDFDLSLRDGSIEPYQVYMPVKARFVGTFYGDNHNRVTLNNGTLTATSRGKNWIEKFAILAPGEKTPTASFQRLRLDGIDFSWPKYAKVSRISLTKPDIRVERDKDGVISLKKLFETDPATADKSRPEATTSEAPKDAPASSANRQSSPIPIPVEIGMFVIEEGHAQFVDRTTTPPFTETVSRLAVTIEDLSSTPGRRARISTQAVIGGASAFDLKGEIAPFGELYADLAGELRDFKLTTVNPYADPVIAWAMKTGQLALKVHYRVEKNQLTADNEIIVRNLTVAPTRQNDEVKKKIGLPLGMIVALVTDADNGIQVNVPISGELDQVKADPSDAIWTAVKNALTNIVAAPFRAISKAFKGKGDSLDDLQVDPVTFAAGSADVDPEMNKHLTEVAGFLHQTPMIKVSLTPVAAPRDLESLKEQEVTLRVQRLQKQRNLPDFSAAVAAAFKEELPGVTPPQSGEAQLAALREREPAPDALMNELLERRAAAVRDALVKNEGIAAERLILGAAQAQSTEEVTEGRIEFQIEQ